MSDAWVDMSGSRLRVPAVLAPAALWVGNLWVFGPATIYATNTSELRFGFASTLALNLWPALLMLAGLSALGLVTRLRESVDTFYVTVVWGLGFLTWLQGNILLWDYGVFGKGAITWDAYPLRAWVDSLVWGAVFAGVLLLRKHVVRIAPVSCAVFVSLQALLLVVSMAREPSAWSKDQMRLASDPAPFFEFSSQQNVLHVILDELQTDVFEKIVASNPEHYENQLAGFTLFTDNLGVFPTTLMSVPAALSGKVYDPAMPISRFLQEVKEGTTVPKRFFTAGYRTEIATLAGLADWYVEAGNHMVYGIPAPYGRSLEDLCRDEARLVFLVSLFRQAPHWAKRRIYEGRLLSAVLGLGLAGQSIQSLEAARHLAHKNFLQDLIERASVTTDVPVYKLMHLTTTHWPAVRDRTCTYTGKIYPWTWESISRQAGCSFDEFLQLLDKLRELGIYDRAFLIVHADHGYWTVPGSAAAMSLAAGDGDVFKNDERFAQVVAAARPVLLIKPPHASGQLTRSTAPTAVTDIATAITSFLDKPEATGASTLLALAGDPRRERRFFYYPTLGQEKDRFAARIDEYLVTGNPLQKTSWRLARIHPGPNTNYETRRIDFGVAEAKPFLLEGWSGMEGDGNTTFTWAIGARALVALALPAGRQSVLAARMRTLSFTPPQALTVRVDGQVLGTWSLASGASATWDVRTMTVPPPAEQVSLIEFSFSQIAEPPLPNGDTRPLAVLFDWLEVRDGG